MPIGTMLKSDSFNDISCHVLPGLRFHCRRGCRRHESLGFEVVFACCVVSRGRKKAYQFVEAA